MKYAIIALILLLVIIIPNPQYQKEENPPQEMEEIMMNNDTEIATFAGGCFWCIEATFEDTPGIISAISGYAGGKATDATYSQVSSGTTEHKEAVQITYDPSKIKYEQLLDMFWKSIDPTDDGGQFADRGPQYKTAIFYHNETQKKKAEESLKAMQANFEKPIVTEILPFDKFYEAEEYHQDYAKKRTAQYKVYETASGRKGFVEEKWGAE